MKNIFAKFLNPPEIIQEQVMAYWQKLPKNVSVAFGKDRDLLIGKILVEPDADPMYIQARTPAEFNRMLNEVVYVAFDIKSEYIAYFHKHGDRFIPTPEAEAKLYELYGRPKSYSQDLLQPLMGFVGNSVNTMASVR
jgi:hypothetical protein